MNQESTTQTRWSKECREAVNTYLENERMRETEGKPAEYKALSDLIGQLVALTGSSREVCLRFARRFGVVTRRERRPWTTTEHQRLMDLIATNPPREVAKILKRSTGSVRTKLHRLGGNAQMGREWFTTKTLADVLHVSVGKVQQWIDRGWLTTRTVETGKLTKQVISPDDFSDFCKKHREDIIGPRINIDRLEFVRLFVFPPSHTELLPVRESKKEREAYQSQTSASSATSGML